MDCRRGDVQFATSMAKAIQSPLSLRFRSLPATIPSRRLGRLFTPQGASDLISLGGGCELPGKRSTLFGPARAEVHPRQCEGIEFGGGLVPARPGYMNVLQARAADFARRNGALLAPFGMRTPGTHC